MAKFRFSRTAIDVPSVRAELADPACGGYTSFEGLVRNHNEGLSVRHLEYEAFEPLAVKEGERIIAEAIERFGIEHAACVHRIGDLAIGDMAVYVGASARHRDEAFRACRYIIDEVKHRVPIWKKEHYENGDSGWVNCERCAAPTQDLGQVATHAQGHDHAGGHDHGHQHSGDHSHEHQHSAATAQAPIPIPDYSRQMALKEVGPQGQGKLRAARVLVVGCGGLGVPVISYLAGAGIGRLGLVDGDRLEASNLHRQTMYALADVGKLKAELATARVRALNPDVDVRTHPVRLDATTAPEMIGQYDLIIDCTDNFSTKFLLNDVCVQKRVPVIFSSVYQYEGQIQVVRPDKDGACLRCVWPEATRDGIVGNCAEAGVLGPVPGTFGSLQAFEALKLLLDLPGQLGDEVLVLDLLTMSISRVRAKRAAAHPGHAQTSPARALTQAQADTTPLEVDFASLDEARAAGFEIIDIREPQELEEIPTPTRNARHIPMAQLLHGNPAFTPNGKTLLVCASGRRSLAATQELRSRGVNAIYSLRGGVTKLNRHVTA
ncbi:MAG: molybdopterin converting factor [Gammaproteobacteria bacterium]|nr:molybdopterin converting factor [Gammaproteobacteria bacterium]